MKGVAVVYKASDLVVYGSLGVCTIVEIECKRVDNKLVEYYVLEPVHQPGARYYIPTGNPLAVSKMKAIMNRDEILAMLQDPSLRVSCWIDDENMRKLRYKELIIGADRRALLQMVHTLVMQKDLCAASGKKFHQCDENFLKDAQKLLDCEISIVLGMPQSDVRPYVESIFC